MRSIPCSGWALISYGITPAILAGSAYARWAVFKAGFASARDPKYTVVPQRRRVDERTQ